MTTISSTPHLQSYDPVGLQMLSDHSRGTGSTPSSNYMTVDQVADYMDSLSEKAAEYGRSLRASGQQTADGYNIGGPPPSTAEIAANQQNAVGLAKAHIDLIQSAADFLSKDNLDWLASVAGKDRVAQYVATVTAQVASAKSSLNDLQTSAAAHLGLQGQLAIQDSDGNYQLGAFALTSSGADSTITTGSNGATQIASKGGAFLPYSPSHSVTSDNSVEPPLNFIA